MRFLLVSLALLATIAFAVDARADGVYVGTGGTGYYTSPSYSYPAYSYPTVYPTTYRSYQPGYSYPTTYPTTYRTAYRSSYYPSYSSTYSTSYYSGYPNVVYSTPGSYYYAPRYYYRPSGPSLNLFGLRIR
jgi:hypothetical protein